MVESRLPKPLVAGSIPVSRSNVVNDLRRQAERLLVQPSYAAAGLPPVVRAQEANSPLSAPFQKSSSVRPSLLDIDGKRGQDRSQLGNRISLTARSGVSGEDMRGIPTAAFRCAA